MTSAEENYFINQITHCCLEFYDRLPKKGKPTDREWTVFSCIVKYNSIRNDDIEVVSLGTGSKCIGASRMCRKGGILNDSHAEVIARRAFILYIYHEIRNCIENKPSIFQYTNEKLLLKNNIKFAFYSSQLPCGDASIVPMTTKYYNNADIGEDLQTTKGRKRSLSIKDDQCNTKHVKQDIKTIDESVKDIYRTGAKCLPDAPQDPCSNGVNYHVLGQVRTKPGRGERTLSVSCSDKISKWIYCGLQGALLALLLDKIILIDVFIFGAGVPYAEKALQRALIHRPSTSAENVYQLLITLPKFYQTTIKFQHLKSDSKLSCPASIIWSKVGNGFHEVSVSGKKQGATKKQENNPQCWLAICKQSLYNNFAGILCSNKKLKVKLLGDVNIEILAYNEAKRHSTNYLKRWNEIRENIFGLWTKKPDIWDFLPFKTDSSVEHNN